jgi:hypothetical protein
LTSVLCSKKILLLKVKKDHLSKLDDATQSHLGAIREADLESALQPIFEVVDGDIRRDVDGQRLEPWQVRGIGFGGEQKLSVLEKKSKV